MFPSRFLLIAFSLLLSPSKARATCASLVKGPIIFDVLSCNAFQPEQSFASPEPKYNFIRDLPPAQRKAFLDSYRGLMVRAKVAKSFAVRSGLSPEPGALSGETIRVFLPPQTFSCQDILQKRLKAKMDEECCEGGGQAPCLLGTSYYFKELAVLGPMKARIGQDRAKLTKNPDYQKALKHLASQEYKAAIPLLDRLNKSGELDLPGKFMLAAAYREIDRCPLALPILEEINRRFEQNDFWSDDESSIRKSTFLLARCLSMTGKGPESVMVLQSMLVEPKRYRQELREALYHRDFGYIQSLKSYQDFKVSANKALVTP